MPPAADVCRKINPCRHPATRRIYHCPARRTDPEIQHAASLESPALLGEAREEDRNVWSKGSVFWAWPVPAGGWTCRGGYIRDHEGRQGLLFCLLPLMPKSCPRIGIFSSQYFPRTQTLLFPAHYLNFSGGWHLIDAAISFYPPSVKSKLPSQL